jgi:hypothetical protein
LSGLLTAWWELWHTGVMPTTAQRTFEDYIRVYGPNVEIGFDEEWGVIYGPNSVGILSENIGAAGLPTHRLADGHLVAITPDGRVVHVLCSDVIEVSTEDGPATGRCGYWIDRDGAWGCPGHEAETNGWLAMSEIERLAWERQHELDSLS